MEAPAQSTGRVRYYDALNILATVNVVWLHFGNNVHQYDGNRAWYLALIPQVLGFWAVPVFLMLSGATLMGYRSRYTTAEFLKRRLLRVGVPYLFWGSLMVAFHIVTGEFPFDGNRPLRSFLYLFAVRLNETLYWFLPVILLCYLCMPVLSRLARKEQRKKAGIVLLCGIVAVNLPFVTGLIRVLGLTDGADIAAASRWLKPMGYLVYPLLGNWAARHCFSRRGRVLLYTAAAAAIVLRYVGIRLLTERDGCLNGLFMDYLCLPAMLPALGVFTAARYFPAERLRQSAACGKRLQTLAEQSFGVYLTHMAGIAVMGRLFPTLRGSLLWYFVLPLLCYGITAAAVATVKRIPGVRVFLP